MKTKILLLFLIICSHLNFAQVVGTNWFSYKGPDINYDPVTATAIYEGPQNINYGQSYTFKANCVVDENGLATPGGEKEITSCVSTWNWYLVKGSINDPLPSGWQNVASNRLPFNSSTVTITFPSVNGTYTVVAETFGFSSATPLCTYNTTKATSGSGYAATYKEGIAYLCKGTLSRPGAGSNSLNGTQTYYSLTAGRQVKVCDIVGSYEGSTSQGWCRRFIWWLSVDYGTPVELVYGNKLCNNNNTSDADFDFSMPPITVVQGTHTYQFIRNFQLIKPNGSVSSNNWSNWTTVTLSTGHMLDYFSFNYSTSSPKCGQSVPVSLPYVANANYSWVIQDGTASPATGNSTNVTFNSMGNKLVKVTVTSTNGSFPTKVFTMNMNVQNRISNFSLPAITGQARAMTITVPQILNATYAWNIPGAVFDGVPTNVCKIKNFTSAKTGTYSLTISPNAGTCGVAVTNSAVIDIVHPSLLFNGSSTYAQVPYNPSFNLGTGSFTMEAWIKASNSQVSFPQIMSSRTNSSNGFLFGLFSSGKPFIQMGGSTGNWECTNCSDLRDNQCHHIAISRNVNGDSVQFYLDGVFKNSFVVQSSTRNIQSPGALNIGRDAASPSNTYFNGLLHDLRIWNVARSGTDIANNFKSILVGNEPGLVGNWRLNEGQGQQLISSIPGMTGTLGTSESIESVDPLWSSFICDNNGYRVETIVNSDNTSEDELFLGQLSVETYEKVYPNPIASGILYFGRFVNNFQLINSKGTAVLSGTQTDKLEVNNLPKGIYLLNLDNKFEKIEIQ